MMNLRMKTTTNNIMIYDGQNCVCHFDVSHTLLSQRTDPINVPIIITEEENSRILHTQYYAFDVYNMSASDHVFKTLNAIRSDSDHTPIIFYSEVDHG